MTPSPRWAVVLAVGLAALALAIGTVGLALMVLDWHVPTRTAVEAPFRGNLGLIGLAFVLSGTFLALRRPRNPVGWLYAIGGALVLISFADAEYVLAAVTAHRDLPGRAVALTLLASGPSFAALSCLFLSALVFPPGHLLTPGWRWAWRLTILAAVLVGIGSAFGAGVSSYFPGVWTPLARNPAGVTAPWDGVLQGVGFGGFLAGCVLAVVAVVQRWRRGSATERLQLRWPALTTGLAFVFFFTTWITGAFYEVASTLFVVALLAIPVSVAAAILRYRLYEIDRLVSRTVAYLLVTSSLAALYFGLVALITRVLDLGSALAVAAATLTAAALFNPLRRRLQRQVDRRFNRARYDADATLVAFTHRLRDRVDVEEVEAALRGEIARTMEPVHLTVWVRPGA